MTNFPGVRSMDNYRVSVDDDRSDADFIEKRLRRSGTMVTCSDSRVRAVGQPLGASMLSPNNSMVNQLTLN